ncbi:PREDICTED: putative E3 ubiquitin-protein ligase ARI4 [Camelina sativa]|uniref:RBR-type E3 ubiquitin transferase n=1 Tax=Camelina sativa TaxID=90675 RepID=A0ABM1RKW9_CAMSA|nr:PREDICTED: putative E3 ubiquitin-protein ligase ARI4 [Camelina sativa]
MHTEHPSIDGTARPSPENYPDDVPDQLCTLYFKGLVSEENSLAGFGVAIFGNKDDILFQMKGPIHHDSTITVLEAEVIALMRGLTEAASMGITHISIYCDYYPVYEFVMGRYIPENNKTALLMMDVQRIRLAFISSFPIFVEGTTKVTLKKTCNICLDDAINADEMFCVDKCRHRLCCECMKRHIEVRLRLEGSVIRCPHYRCKSKLTFGSCVDLLTPKLRKMWQRRIKEDTIPITQRIYCPNPRCSALMSIKEAGVWIYFSKFTKEARVRRRCFECGQLLCIKCKVPWHSDLSCDDYKKLGPNRTADDMLKALANKKLWRQCEKCKHMIELLEGCIKVTCRCGHMFCYKCGTSKAGACRHGIFHMYLPTPY